jgi:hypothetical protein
VRYSKSWTPCKSKSLIRRVSCRPYANRLPFRHVLLGSPSSKTLLESLPSTSSQSLPHDPSLPSAISDADSATRPKKSDSSSTATLPPIQIDISVRFVTPLSVPTPIASRTCASSSVYDAVRIVQLVELVHFIPFVQSTFLHKCTAPCAVILSSLSTLSSSSGSCRACILSSRRLSPKTLI